MVRFGLDTRCYGAMLVVGEDITVDQIRVFLDNTLVGKFMVRRVAIGHRNDQLQVKWVSLLDYGPIFHMLAKGWIELFFAWRMMLSRF